MSSIETLIVEQGFIWCHRCSGVPVQSIYPSWSLALSFSLDSPSANWSILFISFFANTIEAEELFLSLSAVFLSIESDNHCTDRAKTNFMPGFVCACSAQSSASTASHRISHIASCE